MGDSYSWSALSGDWSSASNWSDGTTGANPASTPPGADDSVSLGGIVGFAASVITGTGASASLSITSSAPVVLAGAFTTGTLQVGYYGFIGSTSFELPGALDLTSGASLAVSGAAYVTAGTLGIDGGAMTVGGDLYDSTSYVSGGTSYPSDVTLTGGSLTVAGSFYGGSLSAGGGARVQLAALSASSQNALNVDATSSLEIGTAGGAAAGAITIDAGGSATSGGTFAAPQIIDNGVIVVSGQLTLAGALGGGGQIDIGANAELVVDGVSSSATNTIAFTASGGALSIAGAALDASDDFLPTIVGFGAGDAIDFQGVVTSANYANGVLSLLDGSTTVAKLNLGGSYTGDSFDAETIGKMTQITIHGSGDTTTPPAGTSSKDSYSWVGPLDGSWDLASNWSDGTTGADPALTPPGADDSVSINSSSSFLAPVITGTGASASLSITSSAPVVLAGAFATGTLQVGYYGFIGSASFELPGALELTSGASLAVSGAVYVTAGTLDIDGGTMTVGGDLYDSTYYVSAGTSYPSDIALTGGSLTVAGSFYGGSLSAAGGARVQLAAVSASSQNALSVDATSSLEIGTAGGAAAGAITIDAGVSVTSVGTFAAPQIIDNGVIVVSGQLTLAGALRGGGQIDIGANAELVVDGVSSSATNTIAFTASGGALSIARAALDASDDFLPTIVGFGAGDAIDFQGVVTSANYANGVLSLLDGSATVAKLNLGGSYTGNSFDAETIGTMTQITIRGSGDTYTPPAGTSSKDNYGWVGPLDGSWDLASNWSDGTTGANPASTPPGADDSVSINSSSSFLAPVITGTGTSASLSITSSAPVVLAGAFATGTLQVGYYYYSGYGSFELPGALVLASGASLAVSGAANLTGGTLEIDGGTMTVGGGLTESTPFVSGGLSGGGTSYPSDITLNGGLLTVAGSFYGGSLNAGGGALVQLAALSAGPQDALSVDATSSLEIGTAGGAAAGAITIDAGVSVTSVGTFAAPQIIDNGVIVVSGQLTLAGALRGGGQIDIGANAELVVDGVSSSATNTIAFTASGGALSIARAALDASDDFLPAIVGFGAGDAIDFQGVVTSANYANGVLSLLDGSATVAKLNLGGSYTGAVFNVAAISASSSVNESQVCLLGVAGNAAPVISAPGAQSVNVALAVNLQGLSVSDSNAAAELNVSIVASLGVLSANASAQQGGGVIRGSASAVLTIMGSAAQINADLSTLTYQSNIVGADAIIVSVNDGLGGITNSLIPVTVRAPLSVAQYLANPSAADQLPNGIAISDNATVVTKNIVSLKDSKIVSISATGGLVIVNEATFAGNQSVLDLIAGGFAVADSGAILGAQLAALNADAHVVSLSATSGVATLSGGMIVNAPNFSESGSGTTLTVAENLAYAGAFTQGAGSKLVVNSGDTLTLSGTNSLSGATSGAGALALTGGQTTFAAGATLSTSAWSLSGSGTTATLGTALAYVGAFSAGAGTQLALTGGALTLRGATTLAGVTVSGASPDNLNLFGATSVSGLTVAGAAIVANYATATQSGGSITVGDNVSTDRAELYNGATDVWNIADDSGVARGADAASVIVNLGLFEKTGGSGTSTVSVSVTGTGSIAAQSGTLAFSGPSNSFAKAISGSGTVLFSGGASTLTAGATATVANLSESGAGTVLTVAENLAYAGAFTQGAGSKLVVNVGDTLTLSGPNSLSGATIGAGALALVGGASTLAAGATATVANLSETGAGTVLTVAENLAYAGAFTQSAGSKLIVNAGDTLTLSGTNSLSGATSGAGALALTGGASTFATGATLSSAAWSLSGSGTKATIGAALACTGAFSAGAGTQLALTGGALTLRGATTLAGVTVSGASPDNLNLFGATSVSGLTVAGAAIVANYATATQSGGSITVGDNVSTDRAELYNGATDVWNIADNSGVARGADAASVIVNLGLFEKTGGSGTSTVNVSMMGTGSIAAQSGTLAFSGPSNSFAKAISGSGTVLFSGGASTLTAGATATVANLSESGAGTVLSVAENLAYAGAFTQGRSAKLVIGSGDTLTLSGTNSLSGSTSGAGALALTGGQTTFATGATLSTSAWSLSGSGTTATIGAALAYTGAFSAGAGTQLALTGGALTLRGATTLAGVSVTGASPDNLNLYGATAVSGLTVAGAAIVANYATATQSGGSITVGDSVSNDRAELYNGATDVWNIADNSGVARGADAASVIANLGLFEKSGGSGTSTIATAVSNSGRILATSGVLDFQGAVTGTGTDTVSGASTLEFDSTVAAGQTIAFTGSGGTLFVGALQTFAATLSGYDIGGSGGTNDALQLLGSWTETGFSENGAGTLGTLTLFNGTVHESLKFAGNYSSGNFHINQSGGVTVIN